MRAGTTQRQRYLNRWIYIAEATKRGKEKKKKERKLTNELQKSMGRGGGIYVAVYVLKEKKKKKNSRRREESETMPRLCVLLSRRFIGMLSRGLSYIPVSRRRRARARVYAARAGRNVGKLWI